MEDYEVGKSYKYSQIPNEDRADITASEYGLDYPGENAIHVKFHRIQTSFWFIYDEQENEGIFKCVYKG